MAFGGLKGTLSGSATSVGTLLTVSTGGPLIVSAGDLVYAVIAEQAAITSTACTDNLGNVYTAVNAGSDAGTTVTGRAFYARVTASGSLSSVTFTTNGGTSNAVGLAAVIEGPFQVVPRQSFSITDSMAANLWFDWGNTRVTALANYGIASGVKTRASGKVYCEFTILNGTALDGIAFGVVNILFPGSYVPGTTFLGMTGNASLGWGFFDGTATVYRNGASVATIQSFTEGDTVGMAVDLDNHRIWFKTNNGNWNNSGTANPSTNVGGIDISALGATLLPAIENDLVGNIIQANFGQYSYNLSVPSGYSAWDTMLDQNPTNIVNDNTTPYTCPATGTVFAWPGSPIQEVLMCWAVHTGNVTLTATSPNTKSVQLNTATILTAAIGRQGVISLPGTTPAWTSSGTPTESAYGTTSFRREFIQSMSVELATDTSTFYTPAAAVITPLVAYAAASPLYRYRYGRVSEVISPASIKMQFATGSVGPGKITDTDSFYAPSVVGGNIFRSYAGTSPLIRYRFKPYSEAVVPPVARIPGFVTPNLIGDLDVLYSPGFTSSVSPSLLIDSDIVRNISAVSGYYQLFVGVFTDSDVLYALGLAATHDIQPVKFDDSDVLYSSTLATFGQIFPQLISDVDSLSTPTTVNFSPQTLTPALFSDSDNFYSLIVTRAGFLLPSIFTATDTLYSPTIGLAARPFTAYADASPLVISSRFIPPISVTWVVSRPPGIYPEFINDVDTVYAPEEVEVYGDKPPVYTGGDKPSLVIHSRFIPPMSVTIVIVGESLGLINNLFTDADSFFAPTIAPGVAATLLVDLDNIFSPQIPIGLRPTLLVDSDTFIVTPSISGQYNISLTSLLVDSDNIRIPGLAAGSVDVSPSSVPIDADTLFLPAVSQIPHQALAPNIILDGENLSAPAITTGVVDVGPVKFTDADALFAPVLTLNLSPDLFTDTDIILFGISLELFLTPSQIIDGDNFSIPTTTRGDINVGPTLFGADDIVFVPNLTGGGAQAIIVESFTDAENFYAPLMATGTVNVGPSLFADADSVFNPGAASVADLTPARFTDSDAFFAPITGIFLAPNQFVDPDLFFTPLQQIAVLPTLFSDADTVYAPVVIRGMDTSPGVFTDADGFFVPTITGSASLSPNKFTDTDAFYMVALSGNAVPVLFTDADTFFSPTLRVGMSPGLLVDTDTFYAPQVVYPQFAAIQLLEDQETLLMPTVMLPPHEPTYDYPVEHSLSSDYGIRKSRLRRGRLIIGRH